MNIKQFYKMFWGFVLAIFICASLPGCLGQKQVKKDSSKNPFLDKWKVKAETSKGYSPSQQKRVYDLQKKQPPVREAGEVSKVEKTLPTRQISMTMHNVDLAVLIRALARVANINILINENVKGKADVNIKNAPWDQIFKGVLSTHGLTYAWVGDIIRIMTVEDRDLDLKREAQSKELKLVEPPMTRIVQINYADPKKLKENLEKFLTSDKDGNPIGSVMVDEHTNSLIVQAIADDINRIVELVHELDRPTPQVLIEAHIVEAQRETSRSLGIQWGGLYNLKSSGGGIDHWITSGSDISGNNIDLRLPVTTGGYIADFPADFGGATGFSLGYITQKIGAYALSAQLTALQQEGKLNILSSPSITTLDSQTAVIESGREVPYNTRDESGNTVTEFKDAVLNLEVTPHVIDSATLTLKIKTRKDDVGESLTPGGEPAIITKKAETKVVLFDGQTTVIGGLNKERVGNTEYGVPVLKDIPLLGYLFKGTEKQNEMEDILIFITPHILKQYGAIESEGIPAETKPFIEKPASEVEPQETPTGNTPTLKQSPKPE